MKAPNTLLVDEIFYEDDPYELYIPINELAYSLSKENNEKNLWDTIYWIEWILQYSKQYFKINNDVLKVTQRNIKVNQTHRKDFIWLVWDVLLNKSLVYYEIQKRSFKVCSSCLQSITSQVLDKRKH